MRPLVHFTESKLWMIPAVNSRDYFCYIGNLVAKIDFVAGLEVV